MGYGGPKNVENFIAQQEKLSRATKTRKKMKT
jgi:hypothetical protein